MTSSNAMKRIGLPILPALVIAGTGIGTTASALELGELQVQSSLGQPLRASIAYALGPNEVLSDYCISLAPGTTSGGVPSLTQARIRVSDGAITLTSNAPLIEPLMSARVSISCPYTPRITRDYMFFLDPVREPAEIRYAAAPTAAATSQNVAAATRPSQPARPEREPVPQATAAPIAIGSQYRAAPGDTLSGIASRLEGRQVGLWPAVMAIFDANPGAFIDNDPNQLKAGSLLDIPLSAATGGVADSASFASEVPSADSSPATDTTFEAPATDDTAYLEPAAPGAYEPAIERAATTPAVSSDAPEVGDITIDVSPDEAAEPFASVETVSDSNLETATGSDVIPIDADIADEPAGNVEAVVPVSSSPAEPIAVAPVVMENNASTGGTAAVWWTLGGALALVVGIFAWRRRKTGDDSNHAPLVEAPAPHPMRRATDDDSIEVRVIENDGDAHGIDFDLSDDSPTEENLALDADLFAGHGLSEANESGNADFGFAETTDLDLEITEAAARETNEPETDIIPPLKRTSTGSILESEVLPEDHDYDMSVIMDATKMPRPEEATERDLKAVVVHDSEKSLDEEGYTLSKEVDFEMLEQDYEDEMTATQALNMEIEKAARELASDLEKTVESPRPSIDETAALPMASVTELDVTSNMPAGNDDIMTDLDDTGINEGLTFELPEESDATAELTAELTANIDTQEATAELPHAESDLDESGDKTAEMELKSGRTG